MSKIVIIGGGMAGLTAGIFARKYGFESEIFESNANIGGQCTGWKKDGFYIDSGIYWLMGTDKSTSLYHLWEETGVLGEGVETIPFQSFYSSHFEDKTAVLWRDKERTRKELKKIGRGDGKAVNEFIDAVTALEKWQMSVDMPVDMMSGLQRIKWKMFTRGMRKYMKKYGKMSLKSYSKTFKNPLLRQFLTDYMDGSCNVFSLMTAYAAFTSGNGDIPKGGSAAMVQRAAEKYQSLGGVIHTKSPVAKINIDGTKTTGITLANGDVIQADYVIAACDPYITFDKLLDKKYMPEQLAKNYENLKVQSAFQVSFGVDDKCDFIHNTEIFPCREITVGKSVFTRMSVKSYWYEPSFAPVGKSVLQVHCTQTEEDYEYWRNLLETNKQEYDRQKMEIAEEMILGLSGQYQSINGKIEILDIVTPCTYNQWTGAYKGAYNGFVYSPKAMGQQPLTGVLNGLDNVLLATQWQQFSVGLPCAAAAGKFAVQRIAKTISN